MRGTKRGMGRIGGIGRGLGVLLLAAGWAGGCVPTAGAETCTTQSQMTAAQRDVLARIASSLAEKVQAGDVEGLRALTSVALAKDFGGVTYVVGNTAPKVKGASAAVEQMYLLDGSMLKPGPDGSAPDGQFFCSLNKTAAEADFLIPGLPPGMYAFVMVRVAAAQPWRLSFLLRQESGRWAMAGFYPRPLTAAGHDGLWYWTQARELTMQKESWNAWLFYREADALLRPAGFILSTHLEKLQAEETSAAPPAVSDGVSRDSPLVVKAANGTEYRFVALDADDTLGKDKLDVAAHLQVPPGSNNDVIAARKRDAQAMSALLAAYPELRREFRGVWIFADDGGQNPFASELAMADIH